MPGPDAVPTAVSRYPGPPTLPTLDPNNTISHPTDSKSQLLLSEGVYTLRDHVLLGAIPPHPTEPIVQTTNVLDTRPIPATAGTRVTLAANGARRYPSGFRYSADAASIPASIRERRESHSGSDAGSTLLSNTTEGSSHTPVFGEGNIALAPPNKEGKDPQKRRKPKNNLLKSNSSFVSRVVAHEAISKRLQEHPVDGLFAFVNINRAFLWLDLSSPTKHDQLTKILCTRAHALCHDFNRFSRTLQHLDIIIGFSSGDIIWYEPFSQKYSRLNKNGVINASPVSEIRWLPGSENLFIAAHHDGTLVVYDKEKDDTPFYPEEENGNGAMTSGDSIPRPRLHVKKSVHSKNQKFNPVAYWKATNSRINGLEFSPDGKHLAVVAEDGSLRIIDYMKQTLLDVFSSYYGALTCVAWSPDGKYIITGGQDDMISVWSHHDRLLVARCVGHHSWVSALAFDAWKCDEKNYRFGSVGEDCRLLLWDFGVGLLHRPRAASYPPNSGQTQQQLMRRQASIRQSISSFAPINSRDRTQSQTTIIKRAHPDVRDGENEVNGGGGGGGDNDDEDNDDVAVMHPVQSRSSAATIPPVLSKEVDEHPLTWLAFEQDCIMTSCLDGHIRTWDRPKQDGRG